MTAGSRPRGVAQTDSGDDRLLEDDRGTRRFGTKDLRSGVNVFRWLVENKFRIGNVRIDQFKRAPTIVEPAVI